MYMQNITALTHKYCIDNEVRALSFQIRLDHKIIVENYFGVKDKQGTTIKKDTMFSIGSVSKIFTTVIILKLNEIDKLSLSDPVYKLLPDFKMKDLRYKKITVKMLLNHSAGFYGNTPKGKYTLKPNRQYIQEVLENMKENYLKSDPGKYSVYCNDGFAIAEALVEYITGKSYSEVVREMILKPLNMNFTDFGDHEVDQELQVMAPSNFDHDYPQEYVNGIGSGGIYSTVNDLCDFLQIFIDQKILSPDSFELMNSLQQNEFEIIPDQEMAYGLGWDNVQYHALNQFGYQAMCKSGSTFGFNSFVFVCPKLKLSGALCVCSKQGNPEFLISEIITNLLKSLNYSLAIFKRFGLEGIKDKKKISGIYGSTSLNFRIDFDKEDLIYRSLSEDDPLIIKENFGRWIIPEFKGYQNVEFIFIEKDNEIYFVIEYERPWLKNYRLRDVLAQKVILNEAKNLNIDYTTQYILKNETPVQREIGHCPIIIDLYTLKGVIFCPYPVKVISDMEAIPFIEIPGTNSKEMVRLEVLNDELKLGQYLYTPVNKLPNLESIELQLDGKNTIWFKGSSFEYYSEQSVRCLIVDKFGILIYDSEFSDSIPKMQNDCFIGFLSEDKAKVKIKKL